MKSALIIVFTLFLAGCGLKSTQMYQGEELPQDQHAMLSSLGLQPGQKISIQVTKIDGEAVDQERTSEFLLLPGSHTVTFHIMNNYNYKIIGTYLSVSYNQSYIDVDMNFDAGHSYIPRSWIVNDLSYLSIDDKGKGFRKECMPLRRGALFYGEEPAISCDTDAAPATETQLPEQLEPVHKGGFIQ